MPPKDLIERLKYLAEQAPIDAVLFQVPGAPSCTDRSMRIDVSPRDVLDLVEMVAQLQNEASFIRTPFLYTAQDAHNENQP